MTDPTLLVRPAATLVIVRDRPDGHPELLMTERAATMVFAAGALVFPGGAVDEDDRLMAASMDHGLDPDDAAARIAAIRETLEESGLGIGLGPRVDRAMLAAMRAAMAEGATLTDQVAAHGLVLDLHGLIPFARWQPSRIEGATRIYDTRFYVARAPADQDASIDTRENVHLFWDSAPSLLSRNDAGELRIIFPTRRNLERLALFATFDALVDHAAAIPVEKVCPWAEHRDGVPHLCIPDHLGYPVTSEPMVSALRA
ncbi:MAG: NUDIX hydrolase [Sphingobium sp.]